MVCDYCAKEVSEVSLCYGMSKAACGDPRCISMLEEEAKRDPEARRTDAVLRVLAVAREMDEVNESCKAWRRSEHRVRSVDTQDGRRAAFRDLLEVTRTLAARAKYLELDLWSMLIDNTPATSSS